MALAKEIEPEEATVIFGFAEIVAEDALRRAFESDQFLTVRIVTGGIVDFGECQVGSVLGVLSKNKRGRRIATDWYSVGDSEGPEGPWVYRLGGDSRLKLLSVSEGQTRFDFSGAGQALFSKSLDKEMVERSRRHPEVQAVVEVLPIEMLRMETEKMRDLIFDHFRGIEKVLYSSQR